MNKQPHIAARLAFLKKAEQLKNTLRSAHTTTGRHESTAEHTWRLCLILMLFEDLFEPGTSDAPRPTRESASFKRPDMLKILKMAVLHDLAEAVTGDIPAPEQAQTGTDNRISNHGNKLADERKAMEQLLHCLPLALHDEWMEIWEEYNAAESPEAILVKGFDKLETIFQHNIGLNPPDFKYSFNLNYARETTSRHPLLQALRLVADVDTESNAELYEPGF